jgi:alanine-glyoxylate transaminase/serine-glyoxylate transaminase/serine-pyruvate transaminase
MSVSTDPQFLQTPGPSNVPPRVLRALSRPTIDHRGADFAELTSRLRGQMRAVFDTSDHVIIYPSSGTGAWEAALVNTLSPGDRILAFETGHFSTLWRDMAVRLGFEIDYIAGDWTRGADPAVVEERLVADSDHRYAAVAVVHNETSTGVQSRVAEIRAVMDRTAHSALLLVDAISSLGSVDFRHDKWRVDVTITCSQKGLMLPPGLGLNIVSPKALAAAEHATQPRSYWDWRPILSSNESGFYPYTPPTNMLFALSESLDMLTETGMQTVLARHARWSEATRAAVSTWGLEVQCADPREYSHTVTAVVMPEGHDANHVIRLALERFNMPLGIGLGRLAGRVLRIGHLGYFSDVALIGVLGGVELSLAAANVPIRRGGVGAALDVLAV